MTFWGLQAKAESLDTLQVIYRSLGTFWSRHHCSGTLLLRKSRQLNGVAAWTGIKGPGQQPRLSQQSLPTNQPYKWVFLQVNSIAQGSYLSWCCVEQRWIMPSEPFQIGDFWIKWIITKGHCCFKPLIFGVVYYMAVDCQSSYVWES